MLVTEAFITTTVLFGGLAGLVLVAEFIVALIPRRRWRPKRTSRSHDVTLAGTADAILRR